MTAWLFALGWIPMALAIWAAVEIDNWLDNRTHDRKAERSRP